jgi:membrane protein DedA with SNARE-associated domain
MWEEILKAFTLVYLPSMLKFIIGPVAGYAAKLNLLTTIIGTVAGMMTSVVAFTFFGNWLRTKVLKRLYLGTRQQKQRKWAGLWKKYGMSGVAFLTPLLLTPIGGTILAVSMGAPKEKIIFYMFLSAAGWAVFFSGAIYFFGNEVLPDFVK